MITLTRFAPDAEPMFECASCGRRATAGIAIDGYLVDEWALCDACLGELKTAVCPGQVTQAHARRTDPDTSKRAAASVNITDGQRVVLDLVEKAFPARDFTLDDLLVAARDALDVNSWTPSGVRSRCAELVEKGKIIRRGETTLPSGRSAMLHQLYVDEEF